jgi:hypothetical protein
MAIKLENGECDCENYLTRDELTLGKLYKSTWSENYLYFVLPGFDACDPYIAYVNDSGELGIVDQRETMAEFYLASENAFLVISNS